ncbi:MAG: class I tRNA ligase family protein, partial [Alphaproteobacteria bacterium]|nr:class I tRNA ligase family protein [Alphaproteobacteria bacterium]
PLRDPAVNERVVAAFEKEGADAWFAEGAAARFLGNDRDPADFEMVKDVVDVWFDSGSTHAFVLEERPDLAWPASLYLEGSDQHRGWFHSSLLEACGTRGRAPFEAVLTHGFVLDGDGHKMSKSLGNVIAPQEICDKFGADILRLWVVSSDYADDLRISMGIIEGQVETYRRLRNTLRYLLGNLDGYGAAEALPESEMAEAERWVLHRLWELDRQVRQNLADFDFHTMFSALHAFCANDLSAFYFDLRKDALYCDAPASKRRRGARTVLKRVFDCLTAWFAPALPFTAEEAWLALHPGENESVHLRLFPEVPEGWRNDAVGAKWARLRDLRRVVTGALEIERAQKRIGASLQAHPTLHVGAEWVEVVKGVDLAELCIVSAATISTGPAPAGAFTLPDVPGVAVAPGLAEGRKCLRCWQVLPTVGSDPAHADLCPRCVEAVKAR